MSDVRLQDGLDATMMAVGGKALGIFGIFGAGVIGACLIAAVDPPATRAEQFWRAMVAGTSSLFFGPAVVRILDYYTPWVDLNMAPIMEVIEWSAPVYFLVGALSWGVVGALAMLSRILKARGGEAIANRIPGLTTTVTTVHDGAGGGVVTTTVNENKHIVTQVDGPSTVAVAVVQEPPKKE